MNEIVVVIDDDSEGEGNIGSLQSSELSSRHMQNAYVQIDGFDKSGSADTKLQSAPKQEHRINDIDPMVFTTRSENE